MTIRYRPGRVRCDVCGRVVNADLPRKGDGSGLLIRKHAGNDGTCSGSYGVVLVEDALKQPFSLSRILKAAT